MTIGRVSLPIGKTTSELFPHAVHEVRRLTYMKANEFDKKFDNGAEKISALDLSKAKKHAGSKAGKC